MYGELHVRQNLCKHCGHAFQSQKGRQTGTTATAGFDVSKGRPTGPTAAAGFNVSMSGGRPAGTTAAAGFNVSDSRPTGTTAVVGFNVSEGRPTGTNPSAGFNVSKGRPTGTTAAAGFNVSGGRPVHTTVATGSKWEEALDGLRVQGRTWDMLLVFAVGVPVEQQLKEVANMETPSRHKLWQPQRAKKMKSGARIQRW